MEYDIIIGLEIHAELKTKSKMFCSCDNNAEGKEPNKNTCPICLGHPGTLPVPNKQAIEWTILTGLALHCQVNRLSKFDRKNYFYPDLPKGYQISQYDLPLVHNGFLEIDDEKIAITRIHLEEDTGKLTHPEKKSHTLADYNRAGTPLMEMVTEPTIKSAEQAKKFCQIYQQILRYLDISDANMEKGEMRCEANVSVQEKGRWEYSGNCEIKPLGDYRLNPKAELKNINSFRAVEKAISYEASRQIKELQDGGKLIQETRGWDENRGITVRQRIKESSADYRYFPEPDIPPLNISPQTIEEIKARLIELPSAKKKRFIEEYGITPDSAELLAADKKIADFAEAVISELRAWTNTDGGDWELEKNKLARSVANWILSELFKYLKNGTALADLKVDPENFAELLSLINQDKINSSAAQSILGVMAKSGGDPTDIMRNLGLEQMDNSEELAKAAETVIAQFPAQAEQYRAGKENLLQFFVGKIMAETKGKANPKILQDILKEKLKS